MNGLEWMMLSIMVFIFWWIDFLTWLDWKHEPKPGAREERGHGVVPSAMQNDMMDRG